MPGSEDLEVSRDGGEWRAGLGGEDELAGKRMLGGGVLEGADFTGQCFRVIHTGADLDEILAAVGMAREKIDLEAGGGLHIGDFGSLALQFDEADGLQGMAGVGLAAAVEDGNEGGIGRVGFAGIQLTALFGIGGDGDGVQQKGILHVGKEGIEVVAYDRDALGG